MPHTDSHSSLRNWWAHLAEWQDPWNKDGTRKDPFEVCEEKVRWFLERYSALQDACYTMCRMEAAEADSGVSQGSTAPRGAAFERLAEVKADLDRAILSVARRSHYDAARMKAVTARYKGSFDARQAADCLGIGERWLDKLVEEGLRLISRRLLSRRCEKDLRYSSENQRPVSLGYIETHEHNARPRDHARIPGACNPR